MRRIFLLGLLTTQTWDLAKCEVVEELEEPEDPRCSRWAMLGECLKNPRYMEPNCPFACEMRAKIGRNGVSLVSAVTASEPKAADIYASGSLDVLGQSYRTRLARLFEGTFTEACRKTVSDALLQHTTKSLREEPTLLQELEFKSQCPKENEAPNHKPPKHADEIRLLYVILVSRSNF